MDVMEHMVGVEVEPRDYQRRLVQATWDRFRGPFEDRHGRKCAAVNSVLIESPTGSGKTVIGLWIARCLQQARGYRVGWVAMRRNLLAQAAAENAARGFGVDLQLISMFDRDPPRVDFLVVDEAQHDGAASMASLHAAIRPQKLLGLTATPYRGDRIRLCFEQVLRDIGIEQLIQAGYLSRYHHYTIPEYTPRHVSRWFVRERERWGKSLLFFHRLAQCIECQQRLAAVGVRSEVVTARSSRERQIEAFATGEVDVLISMAILAEGFDCPSLKTVFCRPSGQGCTVQMCGRVFRRHPELPFKQVVQCRRTRHPITRTATADEQYVAMDGQWRSLKMNAELAAVGTRALQVLAQCRPQLPDRVAAGRPSHMGFARRHGWRAGGDHDP